MERLPVLLDPFEDESLNSFVARLNHVNYLRPDVLSGIKPTMSTIRTLSIASGLSVQRLREMTWLGYPPAIIGSKGSTGWLLRQTRWWCPICAPQNSVMKRSWELACLPVCLACATLLTLRPDPTTRDATPHEIQTIMSIAAHVDDSTSDAKARAWLARLLRVTRLIATTCDEDWPTTLPATTVTSLRSWGHHPSTDPDAILQILAFLVELIGTKRERLLVSQGWSRYLRQEPRAIAATLLPRGPRPPKEHRTAAPAIPRLLVSELDRVRTHALARAVAATGVLPEHVPALVPTAANSFLPPQDAWPEAQELALAIHMLLNTTSTGAPGYLSQAFRHLVLPHRRPSSMLAQLEQGWVTTPDADRILAATHQIEALDGVNYQHRRTLLTALKHLPRLSRRSADSARTRGWIWVYLTHGRIVWTAPVWAQSSALMPTVEVLNFHENMTLSQRHELAEMADQLWQWLTADDMITWESARNGHSVETASHARGH